MGLLERSCLFHVRDTEEVWLAKITTLLFWCICLPSSRRTEELTSFRNYSLENTWSYTRFHNFRKQSPPVYLRPTQRECQCHKEQDTCNILGHAKLWPHEESLKNQKSVERTLLNSPDTSRGEGSGHLQAIWAEVLAGLPYSPPSLFQSLLN